MVRRPDGRESVVRLMTPLPLTIVPELLRAIGTALEEAGYTDVVIEAGTQEILGTPPARGRLWGDDGIGG